MSLNGKKLAVFTVTEKELNGAKKSFWTRVGVAFVNKDESITLMLDALPLSGKLQIREDDRDSRKPDNAADAPF